MAQPTYAYPVTTTTTTQPSYAYQPNTRPPYGSPTISQTYQTNTQPPSGYQPQPQPSYAYQTSTQPSQGESIWQKLADLFTPKETPAPLPVMPVPTYAQPAAGQNYYAPVANTNPNPNPNQYPNFYPGAMNKPTIIIRPKSTAYVTT